MVLLVICTFTFSLTSFSANTSIDLFIGDTVQLQKISEEANIPFSDQTNIQLSNNNVLVLVDSKSLLASRLGESIIIFDNDGELSKITAKVISPVDSIDLETHDLHLLLGEIYDLKYSLQAKENYPKVLPQYLKWTSSNNKIAYVTSQNKLITKSAGTVTLTGTTIDGGLSVAVNVTVDSINAKTIIHDNDYSSKLTVGETRQLTASLDEKDVTESVEWKSLTPNTLTVDEHGLVTAIGEGAGEISTEPSISSKKDTYSFYATSMINDIVLNKSYHAFETINDVTQLRATLTWKDPSKQPLLDGYSFSSSNTSVAAVDAEGYVTAIGKGIALITVTADDNHLKDYCTIEVFSDTRAKPVQYTPANTIKLWTQYDTAVLGEKIALDYLIEPADASIQTAKLKVTNGDDNQIHMIDGQYYFIPTSSGKATIKVQGPDRTTDTVEINVKSPVDRLGLYLENQDPSASINELHIGETLELKTDVLTKGNFLMDDVYPYTLEYSIEDPGIAELEFRSGRIYLKGLGQGITRVTVKTIDDKTIGTLKVRINSTITALKTDRMVTMPQNLWYRPRLDFISKSNLENKEINLYDAVTLEVNNFYLSELVIDEEINYENKIITLYSTHIIDPIVKVNIKEHQERLNRLILLKANAKDGYVLLDQNFIKNRNGESYKFYETSGNKIKGYFPAKANITIIFNGTGRSVNTTLIWTENTKDFSITNFIHPKSLDRLIEDYDLIHLTNHLGIEDKIKYVLYHINHMEYLPEAMDNELYDAIVKVETLNLPINTLKGLNQPISKHDLLYICKALHDYHSIDSEIRTDNIYYDVQDKDTAKIIQLNYMLSAPGDYIALDALVTGQEAITVLQHFYPLQDSNLALETHITNKDIIILLSDFIK